MERIKRIFVFAQRNRWKALIAVLIALALVSIVAIDRYGMTDRAQPADVIVVLGSRVYRSGQPGPSLTRRAKWAVALYKKGVAPVIICSGGLGPFPPTEAEAACDLAQSLGVPRSAALLETQA